MKDAGPFKIFRRVQDGEVYVTSRTSLAEAKQYVDKLMAIWPGSFVIRGPERVNLVCDQPYYYR